ncbi:MAG: acetyl-CoA carboxylase biotin carboxyl carrier protein [Candidatus Riflebacteria bacterium]|nr:acetyl-CoA carboxylase biotin carboxyl carrier protein [Candidatus Riflebacteria bacterium]
MKSKSSTPPRTKPGSPSAANRQSPPLEDVLQIIRLMGESRLAEVELETPDLKISLKKHSCPPAVPAVPTYTLSPQMPMPFVPNGFPLPAATTEPKPEAKAPAPKPEKPAPAVPQKTYHKIFSPMAGTFYRAPSPTSPSYVSEGDQVTPGKPVCIVEAMKLMNEIKADKAGRVVKIHVANAKPVEKGTLLFEIDTEPAS